jgi:hypothetical protein
MAAEDELFFNRIKLVLCTAAKVLHNLRKCVVAAELAWSEACVYL